MAEQPCVISKQITINGNVTGSDPLIIEGRIDGSVSLSTQLTIKPEAVVRATVAAADLIVDGEVYGDISAKSVVTIGSAAVVVGDIRASRVVIKEGAQFSGRIEMDVDLPDGVVP